MALYNLLENMIKKITLNASNVDANGAEIAQLKASIDNIQNSIYPVGSIYLSVNSVSPAALFGGTWEQIEDVFLLGAGSHYLGGSSGGRESHSHETAFRYAASYGDTMLEQVPEVGMITYDTNNNKYGSNSNTKVGTVEKTYPNGSYEGAYAQTKEGISLYETEGNVSYTSNMPPYLTVYMWKRLE